MSDSLPPHDLQHEFLYDGRWTKPIDDYFIELLVFQHNIGKLMVGKKNTVAIGMAIDSISRRFKVDLSYNECQARIAKMFRRYSTFAWMLSHDDFMYDPVSNRVHAPQRVWEFFRESNNFSMAYRISPDPKWDDLCSIYGPREPIAHVVVVSSDDSGDSLPVPAPPGPRATVVPQDVGYEPKQPRSILSTNMQRSMWEYVGYASDSDDAADDFAGSSATSMKTLRKLRKAEEELKTASKSNHYGTTSGSFGGSSCASNDPFGKRNM